MDRRTPFSADQVFFDARVVERLTEGNRVRVEMTLTPRRAIEDELSLVAGWDLKLEGTRCEGNGGLAIAYQPEQFVGSGKVRLGVWVWALNGLLLVSALALPLYQQLQTLRGLRAELAEVKSRAEGAQALQEQLDALQGQEDFLIRRKLEWPAVVDVLNELTVLLPDSTWLQQLEVKGRTVHIRGVSDSAASLIALLESSPMFENPSFQSPVTQEGAGPKERFHVAVELVRQGT
jgi:general secretion pathway protein L